MNAVKYYEDLYSAVSDKLTVVCARLIQILLYYSMSCSCGSANQRWQAISLAGQNDFKFLSVGSQHIPCKQKTPTLVASTVIVNSLETRLKN